MKQTFVKSLAAILLVGSFMLCVMGQSTKQAIPKPSSDTLKIPAYTFTVPVAEFKKMADTSNMVMEYYGIEKTGSEIMQNKIWMANQWNKLIHVYARPDTIRVVKGK